MKLQKKSIDEEVFMTQVFEIALEKGLRIDSISFEKGAFVDIGSPENLKKVTKYIA